jgi:hypothetical protein
MRNQEPALIVLLRAIQNEIATQRFYDDAASYCIDPWAKDVFGSLAREREDRAYLLLCEYESLRANGRWHHGGSAWPADPGPDFSRLRFEEGEKAEEVFPEERRSGDRSAQRRPGGPGLWRPPGKKDPGTLPKGQAVGRARGSAASLRIPGSGRDAPLPPAQRSLGETVRAPICRIYRLAIQ